jgi:hypothetical protein
MPSATELPTNHDIILYQGQSLNLDLSFKDDSGTPINIVGSNNTAYMQVRRSPLVDRLLLDINSVNVGNTVGHANGVTGGGVTGDFAGTTLDVGRTGTGGITLNYKGVTGDIRLHIDYVTTSYVPAGRHFYDIDIFNAHDNTMFRAFTGTIEVRRETTR